MVQYQGMIQRYGAVPGNDPAVRCNTRERFSGMVQYQGMIQRYGAVPGDSAVRCSTRGFSGTVQYQGMHDSAVQCSTTVMKAKHGPTDPHKRA